MGRCRGSLSVSLTASVFFTATVLGACGGNDDEATVSKGQYVQRVNEKCAARVSEAEEFFESYGPEGPQPGGEDFDEVIEHLVDMNRDLIEFLEERPWPAGDDEVLDRMVGDSVAATDELEQHFRVSTESMTDPYAGVNEQLDEYGLTSCSD